MKPHSKQPPKYVLSSVDQYEYLHSNDDQSEKQFQAWQNDYMGVMQNAIERNNISEGTQMMENESKSKRKKSLRIFKSKNEKKTQVFYKTHDRNFFSAVKREPQNHEGKQHHRTVSNFEISDDKQRDPRAIQLAMRYGLLSKKPKSSFHEILKKRLKNSNELNNLFLNQKRITKPATDDHGHHEFQKGEHKKTLETLDVPSTNYNINLSLMLDRKRILHSATQSRANNKIQGTRNVAYQNVNAQNFINNNDERKNSNKIQLFLNEQIEVVNQHFQSKITKKEISKTFYNPLPIYKETFNHNEVDSQDKTYNRSKIRNESNLKNLPNKIYFPENQRVTKNTDLVLAKTTTQRVQHKNHEQNNMIYKARKSNVNCNRRQQKISIIPESIVFKKKESSENKKVPIGKILKNFYNQDPIQEEKETFHVRKLQKSEISLNFLEKIESKQILERKKSIRQSGSYAEGSPPRQSRKQNYPTKNQELSFVFDSKDHPYIAQYLLLNGWNLFVPGKLNSQWTLKWINNPVISQILKLKDGQFYNHFHKSFELTSKSFLSLNLRSNKHYLKTNEFYPQTFDIGNTMQRNEFIKKYKFNIMMILLEKIINYCSRKGKLSHFLDSFIQDDSESYNFDTEFTNTKQESILLGQSFNVIEFQNYRHRDEGFQINIFFVILALKYYRKERTKYDIDFRESKEHFLRFNKDQFQQNFHLLQLYSKTSDISKPQDQKGLFSYHYATPSDLLLQILVKEYYFFSKLNQWNENLQNEKRNTSNIWIVKPSSNARGNGIYLETNLGSILKSAKDIQSRIVQKYIEKPLLFKNTPYSFLNKHKFDIRQWVLLKSLDPLEIYMFSHFYIRLASEKYELYPIENNKVHLTNFSANKQFFDKQQDSIISSDEFCKFLKQEYNIEWKKDLQPKIKEIIIKSIQSCQQKLETPQNGTCFQLLGYDIFIDEQFHPWLIEVNMSPACEQRTPWLTDYLKNMNEGLIDIILPKAYIPKASKKKREQYWQRIWLQEYHFASKDCKLQVVSMNFQMKNKLQKQNEVMKVKTSIECSSSPNKMRYQNINKKTIQKITVPKMIKDSYQNKSTLHQQFNIKPPSQQLINTDDLDQQQIQDMIQNNIADYQVEDLAENCFNCEQQQNNDYIDQNGHISQQDMNDSFEEMVYQEIQNERTAR